MLFMAVLLAATGAGSCAPSSSLLPTDLIIVTHLSPEAEGSFGQHTVSINQAYANRYGYVFKVVRGEGIVPTDRDARWSKIKILSDLMEADDKRGAVLWMDSDVVFTNFNFTVLSLAQQMVLAPCFPRLGPCCFLSFVLRLCGARDQLVGAGGQKRGSCNVQRPECAKRSLPTDMCSNLSKYGHNDDVEDGVDARDAAHLVAGC
jgi:hypothetical protein